MLIDIQKLQRGEIHTKFWSGNLKGKSRDSSVKGRDHSEDLDGDGRIILQWILGK
jgi:hypothetical protein